MFRYDAATACDMGQRTTQEDAVFCDFSLGSELGFAVVADGMGGHAAGEIASRIVAEIAYSCLNDLRSSKPDTSGIGAGLRKLVQDANNAIHDKTLKDPNTLGMGTTVVATIIHDGLLHWISVGDSPLYLFRQGVLRQINQDHSLAPQIDLLVASGLMSAKDGLDHPDRSVLTSVLVGQDVPRVDCPSRPISLETNDVVIVASDGLQTLDHARLEYCLHHLRSKPCSEIVAALLDDVARAKRPDQDNVSFTAIRVLPALAQNAVAPAPRINVKEAGPRLLSLLKAQFPINSHSKF